MIEQFSLENVTLRGSKRIHRFETNWEFTVLLKLAHFVNVFVLPSRRESSTFLILSRLILTYEKMKWEKISHKSWQRKMLDVAKTEKESKKEISQNGAAFFHELHIFFAFPRPSFKLWKFLIYNHLLVNLLQQLEGWRPRPSKSVGKWKCSVTNSSNRAHLTSTLTSLESWITSSLTM